MPQTDADRAFTDYLDHGKPDDLARVFDTAAPQLLLVASHVVGEPGAAEDVVQATFLRAIEIADRFERGRPVLPWLTGILGLEAKKYRRKSNRTPDVDRLRSPGTQDPLDAAEFTELREAITNGIARLPSSYRDVLTLRLVHGLNATEIAHALELPPETVKTRLRRGTEKLRGLVPATLVPMLAVMAFSGRSLSDVRTAVLAGAAAMTAGATLTTAGVTTAATAFAGSSAKAWLLGGGAAAAVAVGALLLFSGPDEFEEPPPERVVIFDREDEELPTEPRTTVGGFANASTEPGSPPPTPALCSFEGEFQDLQGWPIEGVSVELLRLHHDALLTPFAALPTVLTTPSLVAGHTSTDDRGRFAIDDVPLWGLFVLRFQQPGGVPRMRLCSVRPEPNEVIDLGIQRIGPPLESIAQVTDASGTAIAGATVTRVSTPWEATEELGLIGSLLEHSCSPALEDGGTLAVRGAHGWTVLQLPRWFTALRARLSAPRVATRSDGRFTWLSAPGVDVPIAVTAPGYAMQRATLAVGARRRDPIELEPLERLEVLVTDITGAPAPDVDVQIGVPSTANDADVVMRPFGSTDADGRLLAWLPSGRELLVAARRTAGHPWSVEQLSPRNLTVRLPARFPLTLRCVDRTGTEVANPRVRLIAAERHDAQGPGAVALHQLGALPAYRTETPVAEDPGVLAFETVPSGFWLALVTAPGFDTKLVELDLRGTLDRTVELTREESTEVYARDAGFEAVHGAAVVVRSEAGSDTPCLLPALLGSTDGSGMASIDRRVWSRLAASAATTEYGWQHRLVAEGSTELEFVLAARGSILGRLESAAEEFTLGAWMIAARRVFEAPTALVDPPIYIEPDLDGTFRLPALEPGTWRVSGIPHTPPITDPGRVLQLLFDNFEGRAHRIARIGSGGDSILLLDPVPPPDEVEEDAPDLRFRGVIRVGGRVPHGISVYLERNGQTWSLPLDGSGRFDAGELASGPIDMCLATTGAAAAPREHLWRGTVTLGDDSRDDYEFDLPVSPWSSAMTTASGRRASGVSLELTGDVVAAGIAGSCRTVLQADAGGFASADAVPAGQYTLRVLHADHGWLRREQVFIGPDMVTTGLSIRLEPMLHASGRVHALPLGVNLVPGTKIVAERVADDDGVTQRSAGNVAPNGAFQVDPLLPGRYRVRLLLARQVLGANGQIVNVPASKDGLQVALPSIELRDRSLEGLRFDRAR